MKTDAYLLYKSESAEHKDIYYLTGFAGTTAVFLQTRKGKFLIVDARYHGIAGKQVRKGISIIKLSTQESLFKKIADLLKEAKAKKIAVESYMPIGFVEKLRKALPKVSFEVVSGRTLEVRARKSLGEIKCIDKAQRITNKIFGEVLRYLKPGKHTELDIAFFIRERILKHGAEDVSFPSIVAFGKNSASPHHAVSRQKISTGPLLLDFGIKLNRYCSDFTRTLWVGKPTGTLYKEFRAAYQTVEHAHQKGIEAVKFSGKIEARKIDKIVRDIIDNSPFKGRFTHGTGHGVGLEIHEKPVLGLASKDILYDREVVTIEPGIYIPGKFGIRIEDIVVTGIGKVLGKID